MLALTLLRQSTSDEVVEEVLMATHSTAVIGLFASDSRSGRGNHSSLLGLEGLLIVSSLLGVFLSLSKLLLKLLFSGNSVADLSLR